MQRNFSRVFSRLSARLFRQSVAALAAVAVVVAATATTTTTATAATDFLPPDVERLIKKHRINKNRIGLMLTRENGTVLASHQSEREFNPASVAKVITALAAMDLLGADFQWQTKIMRHGTIKDGVLHGDLYLVGGGDPYLTVDNFLYLLNDLRNRGIREIRGALVIDDGFFALPPHNPREFDGAGTKPYNVGPGAMVVNFKTQRVVFSTEGKQVRVYTDPPNAHFKIDNRVKRTSKRCRNWRGRIREQLLGDEQQITLRLSGQYSRHCGEQSFYLSVLDHPSYVAGVFAALWKRLGGAWSGKWRRGTAPDDAEEILTHESPALPTVLTAMNKFSNNVVARNVFLSLAAADGAPPPFTHERAQAVFGSWLHSNGAPEVILENGSGLSRTARITPAQMNHLLETAWRHPLRAELISSLPILGRDGTLRRRMRNKDAAGEGHLKTGSLSGITTISGFFRDANGGYLLLTLFAEKQSGSRVRRLQDAIIDWARNYGDAGTVSAAAQ